MRRGYSTITPAVVHAVTRRTLERTLGWTDTRAVTGRQRIDVVLFVAATTRTLFAVVTRYFPFSHETARQAVRANLGSEDHLTARLVDALHDVARFTRRDRRRRWTCALDVHYVPFYGDRSTPGIIGGPKKAGTSFFHAYATGVLIHKHRRCTVGLLAVHKGTKPHDQVRTLLDHVASRGLTVTAVACAGPRRGRACASCLGRPSPGPAGTGCARDSRSSRTPRTGTRVPRWSGTGAAR